jgi:hypothetical protein
MNRRVRKIFQGFAERDRKKITEGLREDLGAAAGVIIPALEKASRKRFS